MRCGFMDDYENLDMNQIQQLKQIEEIKRQILVKILSKEAFERLGRVRSVNPQLAGQAELYLIQLYQSGQVKTVDDGELKKVLKALSEGGKRDFSIKRR
jgi:DNA-binding TFAR19-related protein (PDSD5 family)